MTCLRPLFVFRHSGRLRTDLTTKPAPSTPFVFFDSSFVTSPPPDGIAVDRLPRKPAAKAGAARPPMVLIDGVALTQQEAQVRQLRLCFCFGTRFLTSVLAFLHPLHALRDMLYLTSYCDQG